MTSYLNVSRQTCDDNAAISFLYCSKHIFKSFLVKRQSHEWKFFTTLKAKLKRERRRMCCKKIIIIQHNTNKFYAIKTFRGKKSGTEKNFPYRKKRISSLYLFYDIKIKVYLSYVKKRGEKKRQERKTPRKKMRRREKEKHLARRLVDNIINDYNIEMIDIYQQYKTCLLFCPFFDRLFFFRRLASSVLICHPPSPK